MDKQDTFMVAWIGIEVYYISYRTRRKTIKKIRRSREAADMGRAAL